MSATKQRLPHDMLQRSSVAQTPEEQELARQIIPKLAARSYHLPGYNVMQDWAQYLFNNHPLLGICCHHKLHPLHMRQRFIMLLGSFAFGIAITNAIFLWFVSSGRDDEQQVFELNYNSEQYILTSGLLALVTIGSGSNALFDRFVWTLSACACCRAGGRFESQNPLQGCCKGFGRYLAIFFVVSMIALASFAVVIRASMDEEQSNEQLKQLYLSMQNTTTAKDKIADILDFNEFSMQDYSFLKGYCLEFVFSLFVYHPLLETILFSGILGCCSVPLLGGRPYAMKQEAKRRESLV